MPGLSARSFSGRCPSRVSAEMVTAHGTRRMRRQIPSSAPRTRGLWLPARKSLCAAIHRSMGPARSSTDAVASSVRRRFPRSALVVSTSTPAGRLEVQTSSSPSGAGVLRELRDLGERCVPRAFDARGNTAPGPVGERRRRGGLLQGRHLLDARVAPVHLRPHPWLRDEEPVRAARAGLRDWPGCGTSRVPPRLGRQLLPLGLRTRTPASDARPPAPRQQSVCGSRGEVAIARTRRPK